MPSDAWLVKSPQVDQFNAMMSAANKACASIIAEVEQTLATMPQSAQTSALAPWADLKRKWTVAYNEMDARLKAAGNAGVGAHEAYQWGDRQSTAIMM